MIKKLKRGSPLYRSLLRLTKDDLTTPNALMVLRTPAESEFDLPENWVPFRVLNSGGMDMHLLRKESFASEELPPEPDLDADPDDRSVTEEDEVQG